MAAERASKGRGGGRGMNSRPSASAPALEGRPDLTWLLSNPNLQLVSFDVWSAVPVGVVGFLDPKKGAWGALLGESFTVMC